MAKDETVVVGPYMATVDANDFLVCDRNVFTRDGETLLGTLFERDGDKITVYFWGPFPPPEPMEPWSRTWDSELNNTEKELLKNCEAHASSVKGGLSLATLVAKMAEWLDKYERERD